MTDADQTVEAARSLVADRIAPAVREWERAAAYPRDIARQSGLTALFVPAEAGGLGLSYRDGMRVFEELGRGDAAFAFSLSMHNAVAAAVHAAGSPELVARWASRFAAARRWAASR